MKMSIFDPNKVEQHGIISAGGVAGRDIVNHYHNYPVIYKEDLILKKLLEEHEAEKEIDCDYRKFSDELNKLFAKKISGKLRNLEEKLIAGDRSHLIETAIESKELVQKKIQRFSHYKSAQDIYTYLLTNIKIAFKHQIESKIKSNKFELHEIDQIVEEKIIEPFFQNIQGSSLLIDKVQIYGLLYLLTGNCHIQWD